MAELAVMTPEDTKLVLETVRQIRASGMLQQVGKRRTMPPQAGIYFTNVAGEEIPAWACMQITGTSEIGGQNFLEADKPADSDGSAGWFCFNGPYAVADGEEGYAQVGPVYRGYKNTGTVTGGDRWQPVASQWYLAQDDDGIFICAGADDIDTDVLKVFMPSSASASAGSTKIVQTPGGGIAARSGTTVGSATCTEFKITSGTTLATNANTLTVKNIWPFAIPASMYILAAKEPITNEWVAIHPGVIDVRWDSPDLEQTLDGSTYSIIDTAEVCT